MLVKGYHTYRISWLLRLVLLLLLLLGWDWLLTISNFTSAAAMGQL